MADSIGGPPRNLVKARLINAMPATRRMNRRPAPGQPWPNVENRRRIRTLVELRRGPNATESPKRAVGSLFRVLQFDDSALQPYHGGVGSVVGAQFGEDVLDSAFDGFFGDGELISNLFVGIPGGNQTQDTDFPWG